MIIHMRPAFFFCLELLLAIPADLGVPTFLVSVNVTLASEFGSAGIATKLLFGLGYIKIMFEVIFFNYCECDVIK